MEPSHNGKHAEMITLLSEALDALIDAIESGRVGFDYAVKEYADQADNELASAFQAFVREMKLADRQPIYGDDDEIPVFNDARREALQHVAQRINVPEVTRFVQAMIEAQDQGLSVVKALRSQAEQLRQEGPPG